MRLAGDNIPLMIAAWMLANIGSGIACSMPFAMLGFAVDFGHWKTGIKATGILIAFGSTFCIKMGSGIGTAFAAWIMNSIGYIPNQPQTAAGLDGISWAFIWVPAVLFALAAIPLLFFRKYEAMEECIQHDLQVHNP